MQDELDRLGKLTDRVMDQRRQSDKACGEYVTNNFNAVQRDCMREVLTRFGGTLVTEAGEIRRAALPRAA